MKSQLEWSSALQLKLFLQGCGRYPVQRKKEGSLYILCFQLCCRFVSPFVQSTLLLTFPGVDQCICLCHLCFCAERMGMKAALKTSNRMRSPTDSLKMWRQVCYKLVLTFGGFKFSADCTCGRWLVSLNHFVELQVSNVNLSTRLFIIMEASITSDNFPNFYLGIQLSIDFAGDFMSAVSLRSYP